jgi:N-acetylmuramoyl-L-alanine amidase
MGINKLNIVNGIIQDKFIDGIPVKVQIVQPSGVKNVRTLMKMTEVIGITNHNTGNSAPTAGDELHAKWLQNVENADKQYVSVHLFVDQDSITQTVPLDEVCYHAGDGSGNGNRKTISIEICENANVLKAEDNAKKLNAALLLTYPNLKIYKHQDWSGKYCPHVLLDRPNGWANFIADINAYVKGSAPSTSQTVPSGNSVNITGVVYGYKTAADALNDRNRATTIPVGTYPVMIKHSSGAWNIGKGYLYWIDPKKLTSIVQRTYTVRKGDTLGAIAAANKTTVAKLVELNGIKNPNLISIGQIIKLP